MKTPPPTGRVCEDRRKKKKRWRPLDLGFLLEKKKTRNQITWEVFISETSELYMYFLAYETRLEILFLTVVWMAAGC